MKHDGISHHPLGVGSYYFKDNFLEYLETLGQPSRPVTKIFDDDRVRALELNTPLRSSVRTLVFIEDQDASWIRSREETTLVFTQSS
jgi:hypothetical protein